MKKFLKVIFAGLVLVIAGAVAVTTYQFNTFTPKEISIAPVPENLAYFRETYADCRSRFIQAARKMKQKFKNVIVSAIPVESRTDKDLTIDYCYIPAQKNPKRLLILTSAVHGVEGYTGSAIQQMFLTELVKEKDLDEMGLLLVHGVNPYGFKNKRRVSENNVDVNRNCSADRRLYETVNKGYQDLNGFLNQTEPVDLTSFGNVFFQLNAIYKIVKYGMPSLRQAVLQGQYQYEKGVYFGGRQLEPMVAAISDLVRETARPYRMIFTIDLHTGYGANGTMHLFPDPLKNPDKKAKIEAIFSGTRIDWGDTDDFYTVTGSFATYLGQILPDKYYLTMTFEFGTMDTQTTMGVIKALHNVMIENQGVQYGYKSPKDETGVKERYLEGYYPSSQAWRSKAIHDARKQLIQAVEKFNQTQI